ncbi:MAG: hypothetical protein JRH01_20100 [Deltaproteobacteria bacterium]|nr:hypothetical protein [Deltaproteobacteria bacterium]MBW2395813.1 hypothetical protein [Deltaproteobacteria bacterium]
MSDARPQLVAIDGDAIPSEAAGGQGGQAPREPGALGRNGRIAAALAIVGMLGFGAMGYRAAQLGDELVASQAALAAAEGRIEGYQAHLLQVRERTGTLVHGMEALVGQLGSLASELESLGSLVGEDPTAIGNDEAEAPARP